jgi:hypothetical protein
MRPHDHLEPVHPEHPERLKARVTVEELPGGAKVTIEYADGHTVYLSVSADSPVLRMHLGLEDSPET